MAKKDTTDKPDKPAKKDTSHLVAVAKEGVTLKVHPSTVAAHERLGWKQA